MKHVRIIILGFFTLFVTSCSDYLDPSVSDGTYSDDFVWNNPSYARGVLYYAYQGIAYTPRAYYGDYSEIATDDAVSNDVTSSMRNLGLGQLSPTTNSLDKWSNYYKLIRSLNLFIENGLSSPYDDNTEINLVYDSDSLLNERLLERYKGEALYLRAWYHWSLLRLYGAVVDGEALGIPIVKSVLTEEDGILLARDTYDDVVAAIAEDCDSAMKYLPDVYIGTDQVTGAQHKGGATTRACRALKAVAYTYAASEAYNVNKNQQKWDTAVYYLIECLENVEGRTLNDAALAPRTLSAPEDDDIIWRSRYFSDYSIEIQNFPPSYYGNGETNPSQNLVDAFPMITGYPIDVDLSYNASMPYNNRDSRLEQFIFYDGSVLGETTVDTYDGGKDSRSEYKATGTKTGYYIKKFCSSMVELHPQQKNATNSFFVLFGKTNLYLYLSEALTELGYINSVHPSYGVSAKQILSKIRKRAGYGNSVWVPDGYLNEQAAKGYDEFMALVRNERRIELCFEDQRFWDLRRWNMDVNNVPVYGMQITLDATSGVKSFNPSVEVEVRKYAQKSVPLPFSEVYLMPNLVQNEGW